jgi:drug/metabolite transporter (DMT)-like permease
MHTTSGRWQLGMALAMVTAGFWATLPITLKIALETLDAWTITWARFVTATIALLIWLMLRGELGKYRGHDRKTWLLMTIAALMLTGNFVGYLFGVQYTTPANAQLLIQAAPLLLALGGIFIFRERFSALQWLGLGLVGAGLISFFSDQSRQTTGIASHYGLGAAIVLAAALVWAVYALIQKQLLNRLSSKHLLLFIYAVAALLLYPLAQPAELVKLDGLHAAALLFCCVNTLGAYGAFAEALAHWEASRVGMVLAMTPLLCVAAVAATHTIWPQLIAPERIALWGWIGAGLVIAGSLLASVSQRARAGVVSSDAPPGADPSIANHD